MGGEPLISIIVPVFNVEAYIDQCLQSLAEQSAKNFELIIVNDGSTDRSMERVRAWIDSFYCAVVVDQPNSGLSAARNRGLHLANGDYVLFLDSDDYLERCAIESIFRIVALSDVDVVLFSAQVVVEKNYQGLPSSRNGYQRQSAKLGYVRTGIEYMERSLAHNCFFPSACMYAFRRDILGDLRFAKGFVHEDNYFTPALLLHANFVKVLDDKLYIRRYRAGSIMTSKKSRANVSGFIRATDDLIVLANKNHGVKKGVLFKLASMSLFRAVRSAMHAPERSEFQHVFWLARKLATEKIPNEDADWRLRLILGLPAIFRAWDRIQAMRA